MEKKVRFEIEWEGKKRQEDVVVFLEDGLSKDLIAKELNAHLIDWIICSVVKATWQEID